MKALDDVACLRRSYEFDSEEQQEAFDRIRATLEQQRDVLLPELLAWQVIDVWLMEAEPEGDRAIAFDYPGQWNAVMSYTNAGFAREVSGSTRVETLRRAAEWIDAGCPGLETALDAIGIDK